MKSNTLHILITDDKEHRRRSLCALFREHGKVYRYNFNTQNIENEPKQGGRWKTAVHLPTFDLHLLHAGNYKNQRDLVRAEHCILFGGYGQTDMRGLKNEPLIRKRVDDHNMLTEAEVLQLVDYVSGKQGIPDQLLKVKSAPSGLVERRADFLELLSMPQNFHLQQSPPEDLFAGQNEAWEEFYQQAKQLLEQFPNLNPGDPNYVKYAELLSKLHYETIESKL